jgi:hypothetical protein
MSLPNLQETPWMDCLNAPLNHRHRAKGEKCCRGMVLRGDMREINLLHACNQFDFNSKKKVSSIGQLSVVVNGCEVNSCM